MKHVIGLVVNPIAGIGGMAGFKGSDDPKLVEEAFKMGYRPLSPARALGFLEAIKKESVEILTYGGTMGEDYCKAAGVEYRVIGRPAGRDTTAEDTIQAVRGISQSKVEILVFVGGDGTARDILIGLKGRRTPVVGVPAGVKVFSEVFAVSAEAAASLVVSFLSGETKVEKRAVLDADEKAYRSGEIVIRKLGELFTPVSEEYTQGGKSATPMSDLSSIARGIAEAISEELKGALCIFGPGLTVKEVAEALGVHKNATSLVAAADKKIISIDPDARGLEKLAQKHDKVRVVISPIGGTGFLLGRGNQQITPNVLKKAGKRGIIVVSTPSKIACIRQLLVDPDLREIRQYLGEYIRVITGYREYVVRRVRYL